MYLVVRNVDSGVVGLAAGGVAAAIT